MARPKASPAARSPGAPGGRLAPRQARFVQQYLVDCNGRQAAIRAGYRPSNAESQAARLLTVPAVRAAVDAAKQAQAARLEVRADDVLRELLRIATVDIARAFGPDGQLLPLQDMPEDVRRALASVETEELRVDGAAIGTVRKARFWDKPKALELLAKHLKLLTDKVEHSGTVSIAVVDPYSKGPPGG